MQGDFLVEFATVAQTGSLSEAALRLSISQSCLSRHLSALEAQLGVKLARRLPTGIELTETGRYVANRAADVVEIMEGIEEYVTAQRAENTLTIAGFTVMPTQMGRLVKKGRELSDALQVSILPPGSFDADEIPNLLEQGTADAYVTISSDSRLATLMGDFAVQPLFRSRYVAVMEPRHALGARDSLTRADLSGALLLHAESIVDGECLNWDDTKRVLNEAGIEYLMRTVTFDDIHSFYGDFKNGICLLPEDYSSIATLRQAGKTVLPVVDAFMDIVAVCRAGDTRCKALFGAAFPHE